MKNEKGFSLIELLAVIIILAVITTIVVPSVIRTIRRSADQSYEVLVKSIETSAELYITNRYDEFTDAQGQFPSQVQINLGHLVADGYIDEPIFHPVTEEEIVPSNVQITIFVEPNKPVRVEFDL